MNKKEAFLWIFGLHLKSKAFFMEVLNMEKKKREHIVFAQMLRVRKSIPFLKVNSDCNKIGKQGDKKQNG